MDASQMVHRGWWVRIGALLLAVSACAHRPPATAGAAEPRAADSVTVFVTNHFATQLTLYATVGTTHRARLGYVDPGQQQQFVLRYNWLYGRAVQFVAYSNLTGENRSGYLTLTPGDIVDWVIGEGPSLATIRGQ